MWLTDLEKLTDPKYGLRVVFESGWKRRGASGGAQMKSVQGALFHHDVAPKSGTYPLRTMLRDGRKGLSGPLAHIGFDRDGVVHVIGAGKANHAGTGKVPGVVRNGGNTRLLGIEMTSTGRGDWTAAQLREMPKLGAALGDIFGYGPDKNWSHREYSDSGKIDPYGLPGGMAGLRSRIAGVTVGGASVPVSVPVSGSASVPVIKPATASKTVLKVDGVLGEDTAKRIQKGLKVKQDGVIGPDSIKAWQKMHKTPVDGKITGQGKSALSACPAIRKDCLVLGDGGSKLVRAIQIAIGMKGKEADGKLGPNTVKNLQAYYNRLG